MMRAIPLLLLGAALLLSACKTSGKEVSAADFGDRWPLTVPSGKVNCIKPNAAIFIHEGTTYQLNGMASQQGYTSINGIWRDNPSVPGTKVSISPLLEAALAEC